MNKLEFNEVLKVAGVDTPLTYIKGRRGETEIVYSYLDTSIFFNGTYYAVVEGKIPLEVANIIYYKYPNNPYEIRICGGSSDSKPIDYATDDKFEIERNRLLFENISYSELEKRIKKASSNLKRRDNQNKYINTYHIDTKEGLLILLLELKDYYLRKNNRKDYSVDDYDILIKQVYINILEKVNPKISASSWMEGDPINKDSYKALIERDNRSRIGRMFREAVSSFDKAVNPYLRSDIHLDSVHNYLDKVKIAANLYDEDTNNKREGCCCFQITDKDNNSTSYYRSDDGFSFQLHYKLGEEQNLNILHYYSNRGNYEDDKGEVIAIEYYGSNVKDKIDLRLNLSNGKAGETYKEKSSATIDQIGFVYDELLTGTVYANKVTVDNMLKKEGKTLFK